MAYHNQSLSFVLPLLLITLASMSGNTMLAEARNLLDATLPDFHKPEFPSLPDFPKVPEIPKVEVPHIPSLPELPEIPKVEIPKLPELPAFPKLPGIPIPKP